MKIIKSKKYNDKDIAVVIIENTVYLTINNEVTAPIEDMSIEALLSEEWVPDALLDMEIEKMIKEDTVDEEFEELAKLLD